jgi:ribonuclease D
MEILALITNRMDAGGRAQTGRLFAKRDRGMRLIDTIPDLERLAGDLASALAADPLVAADTEAAGYHRYSDAVCLLQLSTRERTWLVDTMALGSLNPIAEAFEEPNIEIVFHDADYDLRLLDRDFGLDVRGLFDTKIAARFAGARSFGLGTLLEHELGVELEKKYQRADWAKRPLTADMIEYAAMDTRYLPQLRDLLKARLQEMGRMHWAEEEFRISEQAKWSPSPDGDEAYLRLKNTRDLDPRRLAALRELYEWREGVAEQRDVAPFRVLGNETLVEAARSLPSDLEQLRTVPTLGAANLRRWGADLLAAIERARALPERDLPERPRRPRPRERDPEMEARVERLKAVRDREADRLELERGFLMPRSQLEEVAGRAPSSEAELATLPGIREWQIEAIGAGLVRASNEEGQLPANQESRNGR